MNAKNHRLLSKGTTYPLLLLLAGMLLAALAAYSQYKQIDTNAKREFERLAMRTDIEISARMEKAVHALRGTRGLYAAANKEVKREEFRRFVLSRDLKHEFPGVRGFGYIQRVNNANMAAFIAAERHDGAPDFSIRQLTNKNNADMFVVKYIEPAVNNPGALGLDVGSEAIRRAGIQLAINTGAPTVTGAIALVQDSKKMPGLLLYVPVYRNDAPIDIPKERRAALVGVLYAPIVMNEILEGIQDVQSGMLDFEVTDAPINSTGGSLMFDADSHVGLTPPGASPNPESRFSMRQPLQMPGRNVTIRFNSTPAFEATINRNYPWLLFGGGALISALLAILLYQQAGGRLRAENLASEMTKDLQAALRDNEALLSTLNLHTIVSIAERDGLIIEVNNAFCQITGYSRAELLGQNHRILNSSVQTHVFWVDMWKTISSGMPWRGHVCNLDKNGNLYWLDTLIAPFIGNDGQIEKYISISIDISAAKIAEKALIEATQAAQAASLTKSQFLANMSHEIRTPMNAILGMLALLRKTELTPRQADYAGKSEGAARALMRLLNEVLDYSKIEAGKMELDPHPFAIDQILRDLSAILSTNVGERPVEVLFDVDPALPRQLVGDAMRLQQVLLNLGSNAIKFTEQGEVVLAIRVTHTAHDQVTLQFSLRDSGIGIAEQNQARIFSGFTQAESSTTRRFGGSGLGLAISQRFVALMGGELKLQSELGKGSHFYFNITLPVANQGDAQDQRHPPQHEPATPWRLLVIDDNPTAREVLAHMGQSLGWQVDLADSGEQALRMLHQRHAQGLHYEVVLIDWNMPGMDGQQTSRSIRAVHASTGAHQPVAIVAMVTTYGRELLSQRQSTEPALWDGFLVKPLTASMLFDAVVDARHGLDAAHPLRRVAPTTQHRLHNMRLLLAEDNLNNQQVARELLEGEGAKVQIANNGQEAVEAITAPEAVFDVVLMDLQMPVMDGFAATKIIRHTAGLTQPPIVAMTANAMTSDREACLQAGMNDHIGKPFDLNDLVRVLRTQACWSDTAPVPAASDVSLHPDLVKVASDGGVDLAAALHRLGDKHEVYRRMLQTFVTDLQVMPEQLQRTQAAAEATRLLHTIKGLAATLGASALASTAASAEKTMAANPTQAQSLAATEQTCNAIAAALPGLHAVLQALAHVPSTAGNAPGPHAELPLNQAALLENLHALLHLLKAGDFDNAWKLCNALIAHYAS